MNTIDTMKHPDHLDHLDHFDHTDHMGSHEIELFGGLRMSLNEARAAILAHSGADAIREWSRVAVATLATGHVEPISSTGGCLLPDGQACQVYYAGVRLRSGLSITGIGESPEDAIEDLLWQVVMSCLIEDQPAKAQRLPVAAQATCR
jgi:hypothetical protein